MSADCLGGPERAEPGGRQRFGPPRGAARRKRAPPAGEWVNPTVNHVWTSDEIKERLATQPRHQPETLADQACVGFLRGAYWT